MITSSALVDGSLVVAAGRQQGQREAAWNRQNGVAEGRAL
jgi:hypothetical protein